MMKSNFSTKTMCIEFRMYCTSFYIYIWYMALTKGCVSKLGDLSWWNKLYWMYCTETLATFFLGEKTLYQISGKIDSFKTIIHSPRCIFRHFTRPKSWKFSETSAMLRYDKDFFSHIRFGGTCSPFLFSRSIFLGPFSKMNNHCNYQCNHHFKHEQPWCIFTFNVLSTSNPSQVKVWTHPIETTISKWLHRVPGMYNS